MQAGAETSFVYARPSNGTMDCVIPAHVKDIETLNFVVASIWRHLPEVRRIIVIGRTDLEGKLPNGVEFIDENCDFWPFRRSDLETCCCPTGWLLQQMLKLYSPLAVPGLTKNVLVCDADVIWLSEVRFLQQVSGAAITSDDCLGDSPSAVRICTFDTESCPPIRSCVDLHRYDEFLPMVLPTLQKKRPRAETAVCHHMCLQRHIVQELIRQVETANSGQQFWSVFANAAKACGGRVSEYELYHAFAVRHFPSCVKNWNPTFAVVSDFKAARLKPPPGSVFLVSHSHLHGLAPEELRGREGVINGDVKSEILRCMTYGHSPELHAMIASSGLL